MMTSGGADAGLEVTLTYSGLLINASTLHQLTAGFGSSKKERNLIVKFIAIIYHTSTNKKLEELL